jgi:hypothetical protein
VDGVRDPLRPEARVSIETAAEQCGIGLPTLTAWVARGVLEIERHGKSETVLLSDIRAVASWERRRRPDALRERLRDANANATREVTKLQRIVRER